MTRYRLVGSPWGGLYLHHMYREDADPDPHNHPWWFASLVLAGGYLEEHYPNSRAHPVSLATTGRRSALAGRAQHVSQWRTFPLRSAHRTVEVLPNTWTVIVVGPKRQPWGFWVDHQLRHQLMGDRVCQEMRYAHLMFVPWREYTKGKGNADPYLSEV